MDSLINFLIDQIDCCDPQQKNICYPCPTKNDIETFLLQNGYQAIPAKFRGYPYIPKEIQLHQKKSELVVDSANLLCEIIEVGGYEDFKFSLGTEVNRTLSDGINAKAFITKDDDFCDDFNSQIVSGFSQYEVDAYIHFHYSPNLDTTKPGKLFLKIKPIEILPSYNLPEIVVTAPHWECGPEPLPSIPILSNYAITKEEGVYNGYHFQNGIWQKSDDVEYYNRFPFNENERDHRWSNEGAWRTGIPGFVYEYHPSFKAWFWSETLIGKSLNPTKDLEWNFHFFFHKGTYTDEKTIIFQQFKYSNFDAPSNNAVGTDLHWKCDSKLSRGLYNVNSVQSQLDSVESIIGDWLINHDNLDGLFTQFDFVFNDPNTSNPNLSSFPIWAFQAFGGTQGRKIQVKSMDFQGLCNINPPSGRRYEVEVIFTLYDIFGVGDSDGAKWYFPGLVEQWVLQHYRNNDCDHIQCYIPINNHTVDIYHKFTICVGQ